MRGKFLFLILLLLWPPAAPAKVTLTFYSRELGTYFPHAFVRVTGATDAAPDKPIDTNYGFTAKRLSTRLLSQPVTGEIVTVDANYLRHSDSHLSLVLSDQQYDAVLAVVDKWRTLPQPSYDLHKRNCVFFVGDVARALGMNVDDSQPGLMLRPRSYVINLVRLNPGVGLVTPGGKAERALKGTARAAPSGEGPSASAGAHPGAQ